LEKQYVTKEGFNKLQEELHIWKSVKRPAMVRQMAEAREHGDLSENAEYHAAREELGKIDQKILRLESQLRVVVLIDETAVNTDQVRVFTKVRIHDNLKNVDRVYTLVSAAEANPIEGKISYDSPVGKGLMGHKVGETIDINIPSGVVTWTILEILPI
jgi:transcription elongation factor GreA